MSFSDYKTALVTGASTGIGFAIAERLSGAAERSKGAVPVNVVVPLCGSESKFCV